MPIDDLLREGDEVVVHARELTGSLSKGTQGKVLKINADNTVKVRFTNGIERERVNPEDLAKKGSDRPATVAGATAGDGLCAPCWLKPNPEGLWCSAVTPAASPL